MLDEFANNEMRFYYSYLRQSMYRKLGEDGFKSLYCIENEIFNVEIKIIAAVAFLTARTN